MHWSHETNAAVQGAVLENLPRERGPSAGVQLGLRWFASVRPPVRPSVGVAGGCSVRVLFTDVLSSVGEYIRRRGGRRSTLGSRAWRDRHWATICNDDRADPDRSTTFCSLPLILGGLRGGEGR